MCRRLRRPRVPARVMLSLGSADDMMVMVLPLSGCVVVSMSIFIIVMLHWIGRICILVGMKAMMALAIAILGGNRRTCDLCAWTVPRMVLDLVNRSSLWTFSELMRLIWLVPMMSRVVLLTFACTASLRSADLVRGLSLRRVVRVLLTVDTLLAM